jgi:hypothetical protein
MAETKEPSLSVRAFEQRARSLAVSFGNAIGLRAGQIVFAPDISSTVAIMTIAGRDSETITRNRGKTHRVVPIFSISDDVAIWTGYRETWLKEGSEQSFRFADAGFTLHVGRLGELAKPQILRSEWVGRRSRAFVELAGHPHWQLDILESAREARPKTVRFGDLAEQPAMKEFVGKDSVEPSELLSGLTVENMHLASAALWWRSSAAAVAHTPVSVKELDLWIIGCISYLRQEASRCEIKKQ